MTDPWTVLAGLAVVAVAFVLVPVTWSAFLRFRGPRGLRCPEAGTTAVVGLDARHAALTSAYRDPVARVESCSLWPERAGCAQGCVETPASGEAERTAQRVP